MRDPLAFIDAYDFGFVTKRLEKRGLSAEAAAESAADLRVLMTAIARNPDVAFTAWGRVEDALHEFILDTIRYRNFCVAAFGGSLDHLPELYGTDPFRAGWTNSVRVMGEAGLLLNADPDAPEGALNAAGCMIVLAASAGAMALNAAA